MIKPVIILRYITKENLLSLAMIASTCCLLFLAIDLIELLRRGASKNIDFNILVKIALLHLPSLFPIILPTTFLLSSIHTFMKLNKNSELSVIRSSGISIWLFILPAIFNAIIFSLIYIFFLNPIFSQMNIKFRSFESFHFKGSSGLHTIAPTGLWLREITPENEFVINASHYSLEDNKLHNVKIFQFDTNDNFIKRIDASEVEMFEKKWLLFNISVVELNQAPLNYSDMSMSFNLSMKKIEQNFRSAETLSLWKLPDYIESLEKSGFSSNKHKIYFNYLISFPLVLLSMVLLGCILSIRKHRKKRAYLNILIGIISGIFFHFLTDVFRTIGVSGQLPIFFSVWVIPIIFIMILISFLIHTEDG